MMKARYATIFSLLYAVGLCGGLTFHWYVNRIYVRPGYSLQLHYKGPLLPSKESRRAPRGQLASAGEIGVQRQLRGPGRHFYCPLWWQRDIVPDVVILPGQVGLVTSKLGEDLPADEFLVDGDLGETQHKGILRKVLSPGQYRVHPYRYEVEVVKQPAEDDQHAGWVQVPTGSVGVVTNLAADPAASTQTGVQDKVLPPGIYLVNGQEQQIDIVKIGYCHTKIPTTQLTAPAKPLQVEELPIITSKGQGTKDCKAIWSLNPNQAPNVIRAIGNVNVTAVKIVALPVESISGSNGLASNQLKSDNRR